jgi:hypothetical protein
MSHCSQKHIHLSFFLPYNSHETEINNTTYMIYLLTTTMKTCTFTKVTLSDITFTVNFITGTQKSEVIRGTTERLMDDTLDVCN